jgi:hypothetical protein
MFLGHQLRRPSWIGILPILRVKVGEAQGAEAASRLAHEVANNLGNTAALNKMGAASAANEHAGLNQRGQAQED